MTAALWAAVRATPADDLPKLVLADWLEENGDPCTGAALRCCVARGKWPRMTKTYSSWYTDATQKHIGKREEVRRALLPTPLFVVMAERHHLLDYVRRVPEFVNFRTVEDAVGYVRHALGRLAEYAAPAAPPDPADDSLTRERVDELLCFLPTFTTPNCPTRPTPETDEFFRLADQPWWRDDTWTPIVVADWMWSDRGWRDARLDHVQQMLTYCVGAERFADGTGRSLVADGRVGLVLRRLAELRETVA